MSHIFISYSRTDLDFARYLRASLEAESFAVWMDEKQLSAGMDWWGEIESSIDNCAAFVVIMSPEARDSVFVQNEILRAIDQKKPIFPVLLRGKSFGILAHVQFEDMRGGLNASLSSEFVKRLAQHASNVSREFHFEIIHNLVEYFECDLMLLKYAGLFLGADAQVAIRFDGSGKPVNEIMLKQGKPVLRDASGVIAAKQVLFMPTKNSREFSYSELRIFVENALDFLAENVPDCQHLAMTIHGIGLGLDEQEVMMAQLGGIIDRLQSHNLPPALNRISIVEFQLDRVKRLQKAVGNFLDTVDYASPITDGENWGYRLRFSKQKKVDSPDAGQAAVKPYACVLLPQDEALEDIFYFGIQRPIHAMGLLCERSAENAASPQDLAAMLERIGLARALICDVSEDSSKLYLQLGYALGKGIPVALISRQPNPDFANVIAYQKIWELEERLGQWLREHF